jgi:defect in organelle trafficking protein DotD
MEDRTNDAATVKLSEAATSISQSLSELAAVEKSTTPASAYKMGTTTNYYVPGNISIDWAGPVEPLLKRISNISGYKLRVIGVRPAVQVIITLTAKETPLCDILRDIDFQCGHRAKVSVDANHRTIELRYAPP